MSSTYSPDLRIELITDGEQSGTWGDTTNNNLGTLIEQAIAGTANVTTATVNYALTALNGVSDQSRCAALNLNTSTGAPFNVFIPPVSKLYVVVNSSAYAVTLYVSTVLGNTIPAGAGYQIHPGYNAYVYCNGTVCVDAVNHMTGPVEIDSNLSVGGNVTIVGTTTLGGAPTLPLQAATKAYVDSTVASGVPSGVLAMWPTATPPTGWIICDGSAVSRTTYASLYAVIGTVFGSGDGSSTFNLPNYQDRMPLGAGTTTSIAGTGGSNDAVVVSHDHTTLTAGNHAHSIPLPFNNGGDGWGDGNRDTANANTFVSTVNTTSTGAAGDHTHTITSSGVSGTNANLPPYLGINFIIKT